MTAPSIRTIRNFLTAGAAACIIIRILAALLTPLLPVVLVLLAITLLAEIVVRRRH